MAQPDRSAQEWFEEAARCYIDKHQGCPWCEGANRVYQSGRGNVVEYHCGACDFFACHDQARGQYFMGPGHVAKAPATMLEIRLP